MACALPTIMKILRSGIDEETRTRAGVRCSRRSNNHDVQAGLLLISRESQTVLTPTYLQRLHVLRKVVG